jgi:hypothetical protein
MTYSKIQELEKETRKVSSILRDYEMLQKEIADAREQTTEIAQHLGMDSNSVKNHPSVMAYLNGYTKGRYSIINAITNYLKGENK